MPRPAGAGHGCGTRSPYGPACLRPRATGRSAISAVRARACTPREGGSASSQESRSTEISLSLVIVVPRPLRSGRRRRARPVASCGPGAAATARFPTGSPTPVRFPHRTVPPRRRAGEPPGLRARCPEGRARDAPGRPARRAGRPPDRRAGRAWVRDHGSAVRLAGRPGQRLVPSRLGPLVAGDQVGCDTEQPRPGAAVGGVVAPPAVERDQERLRCHVFGQLPPQSPGRIATRNDTRPGRPAYRVVNSHEPAMLLTAARCQAAPTSEDTSTVIAVTTGARPTRATGSRVTGTTATAPAGAVLPSSSIGRNLTPHQRQWLRAVHRGRTVATHRQPCGRLDRRSSEGCTPGSAIPPKVDRTVPPRADGGRCYRP